MTLKGEREDKSSQWAESQAVYLVCTLPERRDVYIFRSTQIHGLEVSDLEGARLKN